MQFMDHKYNCMSIIEIDEIYIDRDIIIFYFYMDIS